MASTAGFEPESIRGRQVLSQNHCTTFASKNNSELTYTSYNFSIPSLVRCENITNVFSLIFLLLFCN